MFGRVPEECGPHKNLILMVDVGAAGEQCFSGLGVPMACRIHQWSVGELHTDKAHARVGMIG